MGSYGRALLIDLLLVSCFMFSATRAATIGQIESCLSAAGATVLAPGTSAYEASRAKVWNHRNFYAPAAIVLATNVPQVQNAVVCAVKLGIGISPRGGGHSYEDYGLGGRDGVLVVDLGGLQNFQYNSKYRTAIVGAGYRLGPLKLALWNAGKATIPSGTCPSVGVSGHALGGGWGFVSRKFGIMTDSILAMQVVINDGSVVTATAAENSDLFRALRGAGANSFGIVTQFKFQAYDVSAPVTYFEYHYPGTYQGQYNAINAFQQWGLTAPAEISASLYQDPYGGNEFYGIYLGPSSNLPNIVSKFLQVVNLGTTSTVLEQIDYIHSALVNAGFPITDDPSVLNLGDGYVYDERVFKSKAIIAKGSGFDAAGINAFVTQLQNNKVNSYFIFDLFGGSGSVINQKSVQPGDGWIHRSALFNIQMFAYWQGQPQNAALETNFVEAVWNAVQPYSGGNEAYQNYIDVQEPPTAYYGANLAALEATKRHWDSKNVFNFNQSIPLR